jgi:hypothetical protein
MDTNKDGKVSLDEFRAATRASIAQILAGDLVDALAARTERGATA